MIESIGCEALAAQLPEPLRPLATLAFNYWWCWQPDGDEPWRSIDPERWAFCGDNPVRLLREMPRRAMERVAADGAYLAMVSRLSSRLQAALARPLTDAPPASPDRPIAFLCAEYGVHSSLPFYAGGLGILAGDVLKDASDRCVPFVAVGLLYRRGYFHQRLDPSGLQHEYWIETLPEQLPVEPVLTPEGAPIEVEVPVRGHAARARVWRVQVGRVPLYLLDTDVPANRPIERFITSELYIGEPEYRLMQYALLGIGAVRALAAIGIRPALYHLNEGHPALAALELAREHLQAGRTLERAIAENRSRLAFTTHTPVLAGNETYAPAEIERVLGGYARELGIGLDALLAQGRAPDAASASPFGMTDLALNASGAVNAVSRRHGEVSRAMWAHHWPGRAAADVPIQYVTNGVHLPTWIAPPLRALLDRYLEPGWIDHAADPGVWSAIDHIPDAELWQVRSQLRAQLVDFVRVRSVADRLARGESIDYVERAADAFDPAALTIGFARRVASYKRLQLLVADAKRALALLGGARPVQVVIAGKAHPRDDGAKRIVQQIFALKDQPHVADRVAFIEDYDLEMARTVVAGCDVWINLPRPPLEASGTSGMKAAVNGGLNLSVLDGWWCEGYEGANGWAIHSPEGQDEALQDARDAEELYRILESEVVPLFHDRDPRGVPLQWVQRIKASLRTIAPRFNAARALDEYFKSVYPSAAAR
ncbi:MAG TPA: alpha-glucan family phosphorylase [Myxococcaceae bacterium]|nr:alpha-glucan family phosphorylase [Myxococcaceae bacterium]